MTPAELEIHVKGYQAQKKIESDFANMNAWLTGAYIRVAIASILDSEIEYPDKPFGFETDQSSQLQSWQVDKMKIEGFAAVVEEKLKKKTEVIKE